MQFFLVKIRGSPYLLSVPFLIFLPSYAAAHFYPGQSMRREVKGLKTKKKVSERACQTARSEVLGDDAGC